jgi:GINS complex protein
MSAKYRNAGLSSYYASFRADDTLISILPAFDFQAPDDDATSPQRLFQSTSRSTNFGPFKAGMEATVPLWMAVVLQQRSFATIVLPEWLSTANLSHILQYEKSHALLFPTTSVRSGRPSSAPKDRWNAEEDGDENTAISTTMGDPTSAYFLPENYYEVALRLTAAAAAAQETSQYSVIALLVQDLFEVRVDKLRQQFQSLLAETRGDLLINVTGIGTQELTAIQPYVQQALQDMYRLAASKDDPPPSEIPEGKVGVPQRRSSLAPRRLR